MKWSSPKDGRVRRPTLAERLTAVEGRPEALDKALRPLQRVSFAAGQVSMSSKAPRVLVEHLEAPRALEGLGVFARSVHPTVGMIAPSTGAWLIDAVDGTVLGVAVGRDLWTLYKRIADAIEDAYYAYLGPRGGFDAVVREVVDVEKVAVRAEFVGRYRRFELPYYFPEASILGMTGDAHARWLRGELETSAEARVERRKHEDAG